MFCFDVPNPVFIDDCELSVDYIEVKEFIEVLNISYSDTFPSKSNCPLKRYISVSV